MACSSRMSSLDYACSICWTSEPCKTFKSLRLALILAASLFLDAFALYILILLACWCCFNLRSLSYS